MQNHASRHIHGGTFVIVLFFLIYFMNSWRLICATYMQKGPRTGTNVPHTIYSILTRMPNMHFKHATAVYITLLKGMLVVVLPCAEMSTLRQKLVPLRHYRPALSHAVDNIVHLPVLKYDGSNLSIQHHLSISSTVPEFNFQHSNLQSYPSGLE